MSQSRCWWPALGLALMTAAVWPSAGAAAPASSLSSGNAHNCAVTTAGAVWCWGQNDYGQLGDGTSTSSNTPVAVSGLGSGVVAVAAGYAHTCAVTSAGAVWCWGRNIYGQLGDGTTTIRAGRRWR